MLEWEERRGNRASIPLFNFLHFVDLSFLVVITSMINLALGGASVQRLAQSWGTDPINFSLCTILDMGDPGLANLFHPLSVSVSLIASCC